MLRSVGVLIITWNSRIKDGSASCSLSSCCMTWRNASSGPSLAGRAAIRGPILSPWASLRAITRSTFDSK